jgi:UDP-N-acetylmuramoyl-tripeptide--D-alanyl-D-alanine ligase
MGANHTGEIAALTRLAPPDVAVELGVGTAHVGEFGSVEAIAQAKAELLNGLVPGGLAVLNWDEPLTRNMAPARPRLTFGRAAGLNVRIEAVAQSPDGTLQVRLASAGQSAEIATKLVGAHHAANVAAAAAAAVGIGLPFGQVAGALQGAGAASPHRMALTTLPDGTMLLDDSYNANPESMRAALDAAAALAGGRRVWAILGPMLELGDAAEAEHVDLGRRVALAGVDRLTVVGDDAKAIAQGALDAGMAQKAVEFWADISQTPDLPGKEWIILVKGSHGSGLYRLASALAGEG